MCGVCTVWVWCVFEWCVWMYVCICVYQCSLFLFIAFISVLLWLCWLQGVITQVMTMEEHTANMNAQPSYGECIVIVYSACECVSEWVFIYICMYMLFINVRSHAEQFEHWLFRSYSQIHPKQNKLESGRLFAWPLPQRCPACPLDITKRNRSLACVYISCIPYTSYQWRCGV